MDCKWVSLECIDKEINERPELYSHWFKIMMQKYGWIIRKYLTQKS